MIKDSAVCKGCKYRISNNNSSIMLRGSCNYLEMTGKSRLVIERANGGSKVDSCICYEKENKKVTAKGKKPFALY